MRIGSFIAFLLVCREIDLLRQIKVGRAIIAHELEDRERVRTRVFIVCTLLPRRHILNLPSSWLDLWQQADGLDLIVRILLLAPERVKELYKIGAGKGPLRRLLLHCSSPILRSE